MKKTIVFVLLLLLSVSFSNDCVGYNESFDVQVLDAKLRPVEGAAVQIKYDRGTSFGEQYFVTPPAYTDSNGMFHVELFNQGTLTREIDCDIDLNATVGGGITSLTVPALEHGEIVSLVFSDVYRLIIHVTDQYDSPLVNAKITIDEDTKNADSSGTAVFYLKSGDHEYLVSFMDGKQGGSIVMDDDLRKYIMLNAYSIVIDVVNDKGEKLNSSIFIFNESFVLEDGHFEWTKTFGEEVPYIVRYGGLEESGEIVPARSEEKLIVFDVHSPSFGDVTSEIINNHPRITTEVQDLGQHASGLDSSSFKFWYRVVGEGAWNYATAFQTTPTTFSADLPAVEEDALIEFRTEIRDKAGNLAELEGLIKIEKGEDVEIPQDVVEEEEQEFPLFYIIIGIIIVILLFYVVFHIMGKQKK